MRANLIEQNRIELQKGMAQEVYDRAHGRKKTYYIETYGIPRPSPGFCRRWAIGPLKTRMTPA